MQPFRQPLKLCPGVYDFDETLDVRVVCAIVRRP